MAEDVISIKQYSHGFYRCLEKNIRCIHIVSSGERLGGSCPMHTKTKNNLTGVSCGQRTDGQTTNKPWLFSKDQILCDKSHDSLRL